jgi:hypothetical protein
LWYCGQTISQSAANAGDRQATNKKSPIQDLKSTLDKIVTNAEFLPVFQMLKEYPPIFIVVSSPFSGCSYEPPRHNNPFQAIFVGATIIEIIIVTFLFQLFQSFFAISP